MAKAKAPKGRPPKVKVLDKSLALRATSTEVYTIKQAASEARVTVSMFLRRKLGLDKEATE